MPPIQQTGKTPSAIAAAASSPPVDSQPTPQALVPRVDFGRFTALVAAVPRFAARKAVSSLRRVPRAQSIEKGLACEAMRERPRMARLIKLSAGPLSERSEQLLSAALRRDVAGVELLAKAEGAVERFRRAGVDPWLMARWGIPPERLHTEAVDAGLEDEASRASPRLAKLIELSKGPLSERARAALVEAVGRSAPDASLLIGAEGATARLVQAGVAPALLLRWGVPAGRVHGTT